MLSPVREKIYWLVIVLLLSMCAQFWYSYHYLPARQRQVKVFYNRQQPLNREVINVIREADKFVYFSIYTFTRTDIQDALLAAKERGLEVRGVADREQSTGLPAQAKILEELKKAGIPVGLDDHSGIMHLKAVVTDKGYASGSYNWTAAATEANDEVLEIGTDPDIRKGYERVLRELLRRYPPAP